jgi:ABC-type molybdate transport system ATPase subunit
MSITLLAASALNRLADRLHLMHDVDDDRVVAEEKLARLLARADLNDWDVQFRALSFLTSLIVLVENWHETYTLRGAAAEWARKVDDALEVARSGHLALPEADGLRVIASLELLSGKADTDANTSQEVLRVNVYTALQATRDALVAVASLVD